MLLGNEKGVAHLDVGCACPLVSLDLSSHCCAFTHNIRHATCRAPLGLVQNGKKFTHLDLPPVLDLADETCVSIHTAPSHPSICCYGHPKCSLQALGCIVCGATYACWLQNNLRMRSSATTISGPLPLTPLSPLHLCLPYTWGMPVFVFVQQP